MDYTISRVDKLVNKYIDRGNCFSFCSLMYVPFFENGLKSPFFQRNTCSGTKIVLTLWVKSKIRGTCYSQLYNTRQQDALNDEGFVPAGFFFFPEI